MATIQHSQQRPLNCPRSSSDVAYFTLTKVIRNWRTKERPHNQDSRLQKPMQERSRDGIG